MENLRLHRIEIVYIMLVICGIKYCRTGISTQTLGLDMVRYHGHDLTILDDQDGSRYHVGKGLQVWVDGKLAGQRDTLGKLVVKDAFK